MSSHRDGDDTLDVPVVLAWQIACGDVDRAQAHDGYARTFLATEAERKLVVDALGLTQCFAVSAQMTIRARAGDRYVVQGRLLADIEQACGVTLEPVPEHIDERFEGDFCPASDMAPASGGDAHFEIDSDDEPIAIVDGMLDVGQLVFENLALSINPFPRAADADEIKLERGPSGPTKSGETAGEREPGPFAVLAKLKPGKAE